MSARAVLLLLLALLPGAAGAQGYGGLGSEAEGFAEVTRPADLRFPRDHGAHPGFRIEWWYLTAALTGADGRDYGVQWTLFRLATEPGDAAEVEGTDWASGILWMGHAGLTTPDRHFSDERFARGGTGQAGVTTAPFAAWIDDWALESRAPPEADPLDALAIRARGPGFAYALDAVAEGPLVRHGEDGFSLKAAAGQASYYYSQPFLRVEGSIEIDGAEVAVTGDAWLDREWSSQAMSPDQTGWDWFSLRLDGGDRLMAYRLRETEGPSHAFGTWIAADGTALPLGPGEVDMTPLGWEEVAGRRMPVAWRLEVPRLGIALETEPVNPQSWMAGLFPYWEGPIRASGDRSGRGYLEMTGYE